MDVLEKIRMAGVVGIKPPVPNEPFIVMENHVLAKLVRYHGEIDCDCVRIISQSVKISSNGSFSSKKKYHGIVVQKVGDELIPI